MAKAKTPYYQKFAEDIIEKLKEGTAPWQRPWKPGEYQPAFNPVSGTVYRGINQVMLGTDGLNDPRFMTYKQAESQGWQVSKGSKSRTIVFWQMSQINVVKDDKNKPVRDEEGKILTEQVQLSKPILRFSNVFHASQIEGIPEWDGRKISWNPDERAESILQNSGASITHDQRNRAFYGLSTDEIHLPPHAAFESSDRYYSTALHELGHWTGHESRLDREFGPFGSEIYAKEELRAEIASWMLSSELGLGHDPDQHLSYVENWVKVLEKDPFEIVRACQSADKIKNYTLDFEKERSMEKTKEQGMNMSAPDKAKLEQRESMSGVPKDGKTYLEVPFSKKEEVKKHGAKWDKDKKMWFAPEGTDLEKLSQWIPDSKTIAPQKENVKQEKETNSAKNLATEKTYLNVPYKEKWQAKKLGARWDKSAKLWFAATGTDLEQLSKWIPKDKAIVPATNAEQEFAKAIQEAGLDLQGELPIMDGNLYRVPVIDGKFNSKDGTYKGYLDGHPAGFIQNHKTGLKMNWKAEGHTLTDEQKAELKAQAAQTRLEREKAIKEQYANAATLSKEKWEKIIKPANKEHPYLSKKGVPRYGLKEDKFGNLVIPGKDVDGNIRTLQTISPNGKFFEKNAQKAGTFHIIDPENKLKNGNPILIAEGYATAASVHMATGNPVASAFDASNLEPVAKALHEKYPQSKIMLMADNDYHLIENVGVKKAEAAAKAVNGIVLIPKFSEQERTQKLTDFNDLHKSSGLDAVKKQLSGIFKTPKKNIQKKASTPAMAM
ncbi:zincin-like metallopeptidase domain-containing protein [Maridesulfovibrio ferrireducens]|uniref:zincin-like metallopeptidase domain-containing protein n=1 Tax=Maridesulfovibrio ferrireducens TaxID=246191 RepID=UPI001A30EE19|nr:zincin-like metallopeptidase domain-containing protein [Maridesulfovibrio ferrireducens]MBI9112365.1 DUF1738 domain-containing protein [Maridesulfovibrio ferrireducens]